MDRPSQRKCPDEQFCPLGARRGAPNSRSLWNMLQLGAPRPRGRAPLGSTRQVGLARTEVTSPQLFQRARGAPGVSDHTWAWLHFSGSPGDEEGQGWLDHGRLIGLGVGKIIRALSAWASSAKGTGQFAQPCWPGLSTALCKGPLFQAEFSPLSLSLSSTLR